MSAAFRTAWFRSLAWLALAAPLVALPAARAQAPAAPGGKAAPAAAATRADYRSQHFMVHTDLSAAEAKDLLERLETMLGIISTYWGRPLGQVIELYVIKDLKNWPEGTLPDADGRQHVEAGGGVTLASGYITNKGFEPTRVVAYAVADRGTPQHEAVHAYCRLTFGEVGPVWYSEGMAEMGQYWKKDDKAVQIHDVVVQYLRSSEPKTLNGIVNNVEATGDSWQNYAWRWALCHLLATNPNYADRFRPLGLALLTTKGATFEQTYGDMAAEVSFEYLFFLQHVGNGFRTDLCAIDWKRRKVPLAPKATLTSRVMAGRGWQNTGALVTKGTGYAFDAAGTWQTAADAEPTSADGADQGRGRLVGTVMKEYKLSEPFDLGTKGTFYAPSDGLLFLRCQDDWCQLADNKGTVTVKLKQDK